VEKSRVGRKSNRRRQELERLYDLSQRLLHAGGPAELCHAIPQSIVESFGVRAAALFISSKQEFYRAGSDIAQLDDGLLRIAATGEEMAVEETAEVCFVALRSGENVIGSMAKILMEALCWHRQLLLDPLQSFVPREFHDWTHACNATLQNPSRRRREELIRIC
jgi:uncharacterized protein YigA (DUF484 family)